MKRYLIMLLPLFLLALAACSGGNDAANREPTIPLASCRLPGGVMGQCGTLTVLENRELSSGRTIDLDIAVLPATGSSSVIQPEPLFLLAGGPGQAATEAYPLAAYLFEEVNRTRDIVLVDQRGTGDSNGLDCENLEDESLPEDMPDEEAIALLEDCRVALAERADLTQYTTDRFIEDLEEVRAALDYDTINLYGASYGSRAALAYMRRHPERIRSAVLDAVAGPDLVLFRDMPRDGQRAFDLLFDRCEADAACSEAFPDVRAEYDALLARLDEERPITVIHPLTNEPLSFLMDRQRLSQYIFNILYSPELHSLLPLLIHHTHETDDFTPLVVQALALSDGAGVYPGLLYAVACSEDAPLIDPAAAGAIAQDSSFASLVDNFAAICATWPRAEVADDLRQPLTSDVPTLLLSGSADPVTPPDYAETVAQTLTNSRHLVVPGFAHGVLSAGCVPRLVAQFINDGGAAELDAACLDELEPPPFFVTFAGPQP